jgi:hypothetical protein
VIGQKIQMLVFCWLAVVCAAQIQILWLLLQFIQAPAFAFLAMEVLHVFHALLAGTRQVRVQQSANVAQMARALQTCGPLLPKTA